MWSYEHSVDARELTRQQVWAVWADLPNWPTWDTAAAWVRPDTPGPMVAGMTYTIQPRRRPRARSRITAAEPGRSFADETHLFLCRLIFDHTVVDLPGGGVRLTHRVMLAGPLAFAFVPLLGVRIAAGIPAVVANLVARAAKSPPAAGVD